MKAAVVAVFGLPVALVGSASAQVRPSPGIGDPHEQSITFEPDQVTIIESSPGYQVAIELAPDEQIQNVAVGDSNAWQVNANKAGNHLFAKPLQPGVATNMTVLTNVRRYSFRLDALSRASSTMPYTVRFLYPPSGVVSYGAGTGKVVGLYRLSGDRALRPRAVSDDGVHTYIDWAPDVDLPAVYRIERTGREVLANGEMRGGIYVLDEVAPRLLFRIDKHVAQAVRQRPDADER